MVMDVHLRDLRYFLAVARSCTSRRAAETLYVSQPALSKQIRALERQLRVTLFDRDRGGVRLTRAGAELVPRAERDRREWEARQAALARASDCDARDRDAHEPGPRAAARRCARGWSATARSRARAAPGRVGRSHRRARGARTDAAFVWLPLPQPPYRWVTIAREPRLVAMPTATRSPAVTRSTMADLLDEPFLALPQSAGPLRDYWLAPTARRPPGASPPRSTTPRRPTRRSRAGSASACWRPATPRSSPAAT